MCACMCVCVRVCVIFFGWQVKILYRQRFTGQPPRALGFQLSVSPRVCSARVCLFKGVCLCMLCVAVAVFLRVSVSVYFSLVCMFCEYSTCVFASDGVRLCVRVLKQHLFVFSCVYLCICMSVSVNVCVCVCKVYTSTELFVCTRVVVARPFGHLPYKQVQMSYFLAPISHLS